MERCSGFGWRERKIRKIKKKLKGKRENGEKWGKGRWCVLKMGRWGGRRERKEKKNEKWEEKKWKIKKKKKGKEEEMRGGNGGSVAVASGHGVWGGSRDEVIMEGKKTKRGK